METKDIQKWKFTQSQFEWLIDIIENKTTYTNSWAVRSKASELIREYGYRGWYDMGGKVELLSLRQAYLENYNRRKEAGDGDLPF